MAKWRDLQDLTVFLKRAEARAIYQQLKFVDQPEESDDDYVDNPPTDAGKRSMSPRFLHFAQQHASTAKATVLISINEDEEKELDHVGVSLED
ncbi:hypothetical protein JTB14_003610 [Gonioctena quinquepunctata]|nr:hypothetical protein JTB14_003610 [Gonioctena quinquepunctata]